MITCKAFGENISYMTFSGNVPWPNDPCQNFLSYKMCVNIYMLRSIVKDKVFSQRIDPNIIIPYYSTTRKRKAKFFKKILQPKYLRGELCHNHIFSLSAGSCSHLLLLETPTYKVIRNKDIAATSRTPIINTVGPVSIGVSIKRKRQKMNS
ncbi:hypothetical protein ACOSP7_031885 [Xanthoceras sorbifolium]